MSVIAFRHAAGPRLLTLDWYEQQARERSARLAELGGAVPPRTRPLLVHGMARQARPAPRPVTMVLSPYPPGWPRCPGCRRPALDGHITCGEARCNEGAARHRQQEGET